MHSFADSWPWFFLKHLGMVGLSFRFRESVRNWLKGSYLYLRVFLLSNEKVKCQPNRFLFVLILQCNGRVSAQAADANRSSIVKGLASLIFRLGNSLPNLAIRGRLNPSIVRLCILEVFPRCVCVCMCVIHTTTPNYLVCMYACKSGWR